MQLKAKTRQLPREAGTQPVQPLHRPVVVPPGAGPQSPGEWAALLVPAIRKLRVPEQRVVIWRYFDDCSLERVAARLQVSPERVRVLLRQALWNLRQQLVECVPASVGADGESDGARLPLAPRHANSGAKTMTDKQLREEVLAELDFEPAVNAEHVGVSAEGGVVLLTGRVDSYGEKLAAERAAKRVYSAKAVVNDLEVKLAARDEVPDAELARAAIQALQDSSLVPRDTIRLVVRDGHVTLEGRVSWQYQKTAAEKAVRYLRGIRGVLNQIQLTPRVSPGDVKEQIEGALRRSAEVEADRIQVETLGGKVVLRGKVHSWHEMEEAAEAAWRAPGVTYVENELILQP